MLFAIRGVARCRKSGNLFSSGGNLVLIDNNSGTIFVTLGFTKANAGLLFRTYARVFQIEGSSRVHRFPCQVFPKGRRLFYLIRASGTSRIVQSLPNRHLCLVMSEDTTRTRRPTRIVSKRFQVKRLLLGRFRGLIRRLLIRLTNVIYLFKLHVRHRRNFTRVLPVLGGVPSARFRRERIRELSSMIVNANLRSRSSVFPLARYNRWCGECVTYFCQ